MIDDRITVVLGTDLKRKVKSHCVDNGTTIKDYVTNLILSDI